MPRSRSTSVERPLLGEPLGLDLLNTVWLSKAGPRDLLADLDGLRQWLQQAGLELPATPAARSALVTARAAIRAHVDDPGSEHVRAWLNDVLAWGHSWPVLGPDGPGTASTVADPARQAGWLAAVNYAELLAKDASRIRRCAHAQCVLHFYDTSPKRSRRWCSMAGCGNRAKAARHYARSKRAATSDDSFARAGSAPAASDVP